MSKMGMSLGLLTLAVVICFGAYLRLAPSDPAVWHVDPFTVRPPDKPNFDLVRIEDGSRSNRVFAEPPAEVMARFDAIARSAPRVTVLAGSVEEAFVTYIARSAFWGFPDYISVRAIPAEDGGTEFAAFSRARFGQSDMGVNAARMERWLGALAQETG